MAGRREVNVGRPEHSWIPFYRELAEKLVHDGWRERQGELVGVLKRLKANGVPIHGIVDNLTDHIDPFTIYALFSRGMTFEKTLRVIDSFRSEFKLFAGRPKEQPFIPYANNLSIGYFLGFDDIADDIETMWDIFEITTAVDSFEDISKDKMMMELIDKGLKVKGVGVSKLTSALYWVNPYNFLHSHTVDAIGGRDLKIETRDEKTYLACLMRTREKAHQSYPEINISVFKSQNPDWEPPRVWIVRGGSSGTSVNYQLENGIAGIGFNLGGVDLSRLFDSEAIREAYASHNPNAGEGTIIANTGSVAKFVLDIRICDYVLMPDGHGQRIHYGKVVSDPYHVPNRRWENRRDIEWANRVMSRADLPSLPARTRTVTQATDRVKEEFWTWIHSQDDESEYEEIEYDENEDDESDGESEGTRPYGIDDMLKDELFFEPGELVQILERFRDKKNLILQGSPGVGKTFVSKRLAYALMGERADDRIRNVQFHQSYSYEEFVQGYRPATNENDELKFELRDGAFLELCDEARDKPDDLYVMVIDEINRGNLSRVFGELLSLVEKDKRGEEFEVTLSGGRRFSVPENVYILGTMNLADRSLAGMDYAMRRRFAFVTLEPQFGKQVFLDWLSAKDVPGGMISRINDRMLALNDEIAKDSSLGRNFAVGHSYFCDIAGSGKRDWDAWYREIVRTEIEPLLEEYWFDNLTKADAEVEKLLAGVV